MPEFVSVLQGDKSKTVVTVTKERAEALGLDVLDQPATDRQGRPLGAREVIAQAMTDLKGQALDEALDSAGLAKTGSAAEKRARLVAHNDSQEV